VYVEGGNPREFCPIEATVLIVGRVLLAVLDSFARNGIEVWRRFWLFQCVVHWQGRAAETLRKSCPVRVGDALERGFD
jgi:hypothetical protein